MRGWRGVGLVAGWQTVASLSFYAIFAATAFLRADFGLSRTLVGATITVTMLGYTLLLFAMGAAVDGYGERRVMVAGLLALALGAAGIAVAPSYPVLLVALLVLGGAYATAMPATNRAVLAVAPPGRRNLTMSVKQVGVTVGSGASAVLVTRAAATRAGWQAGFLAVAGAATVVALAFGYRYRGDGGTGSMGLPDLRGLLGRRGYRLLVAAGFFYGAAIFTTTAYVVLYLTESVRVGAGLAGTVLALVQLAGSGGRIGGGALVDRLQASDARASALVLVGQSAVGAGCLVAATAVDTVAAAVVGFAALGLFVFGIPATYYACMTALVPSDRVGEATAGGQLTINAGGLLAPPTFGYLADTAGYQTAWVTLAGGVAVAALLLGRLASLARG
jgi:MFS family permease